MIEEAIQHSVDVEKGLYAYPQIWAMEGLLPGAYQAMDPMFWKRDRLAMINEADRLSRGAFRNLILQMKEQREGGEVGDVEMADLFGPEPSRSISVGA